MKIVFPTMAYLKLRRIGDTNRLLTSLLVAVAFGLVFVAAFMAAGVLPVQDLAQYWSAAHLVRQNPYSYETVVQFEHAHNIAVDPPLVLKNPPWSIPFVLPLGLLSYRAAFAVWTVISFAIGFLSTRAMWRRLSRKPSVTPLLLALFFGPTFFQLILGQWTILVLLGVALFLINVTERRDWPAGASLVFVVGKPHLMLLFTVAVVLWVFQEKRWRVLISAFVSVLVASATVTALNPHIWSQFLRRTTLVVDERGLYPNLGGMFYAVSGVQYLALIPPVAGLIWFALYWGKHRRNWDWWEHGTMVVLCSVVCSFYSYPYDEILAIPALLVALAKFNRRWLLIAFLVTDVGYALYIFKVVNYGYMFLWWTASGWLITCLVSRIAGSTGQRWPDPKDISARLS